MPVSVKNRIALEAFHGLLGAEDRLAQRMILPEVLSEDFVDEVVRVVLVHLDLFENDAPFADDVLGIKYRAKHQVAEDIERNRQMLIQDLDVETDAFLGGKSVHIPTDGVDLAGDLLGGATLGAFEDHMLDEMGDAIPLGVLITGAGLEPHANGSRANVRHLLGDDGEAVGQHLTPDVARFLHHECFRSKSPTCEKPMKPLARRYYSDIGGEGVRK